MFVLGDLIVSFQSLVFIMRFIFYALYV